MTKQRQTQLFNTVKTLQQGILLDKGDDYSNQDRLSNFKLAGAISGTTAELNCLNLISTKVARLGVLLNSKSKPKNESVEDTLLDLQNYGFLLQCLIEEGKTK